MRKTRRRKYGLALFWLLLLGVAFFGGRWLVVFSDLVKKIPFPLQEDSLELATDLVRGTIFDRNYKELAVSLERVSVYVRTREITSPEDIASRLAVILDRDQEALLDIINNGGLRNWLARNITQEQEETIRNLHLRGVYLAKDYSRFYPQQESAAHIVGFAADGLGLGGAESYYDWLLSQFSVDKERPFDCDARQHLLLTLDMKLQQIVEDLVAQFCVQRPEAKIGFYVMDSVSGAIVGAAQHPSFNPNEYRLYDQDVLESLLVKPMVLPKLFRSFLRTASQLEGQFERQKKVLPWSLAFLPHNLGGELQLWQALGVGNEPSREFMIAPGTASLSETYPDASSFDGDFGTVPVMLSPLGLLNALGSLLNGGTVITAHVADAVIDPESGVAYPLQKNRAAREKKVVARQVSSELAHLARSYSVANNLGAVCWQDEAAISMKKGQQHYSTRNELLFGAFPVFGTELVMLLTLQSTVLPGAVVNESPAVKAQTLFLQALPRMVALQQVGKGLQTVAEPDQEQVRNFPRVGRDAGNRETPDEEMSERISPGFMPNIVGLSLRKGLRLLQERRCEVRVYGTGRIVAQEPAAGAMLGDDVKCILRLERDNGAENLFSEQVEH